MKKLAVVGGICASFLLGGALSALAQEERHEEKQEEKHEARQEDRHEKEHRRIADEHFREHFAIAAQESIAAGATLAIEVSDDLDDPHAQNVRLESVDLDECKPKGGWISSGCVSEERWLVKRHVLPPHCN